MHLRAKLPTNRLASLDIAVEFLPGKIGLLAAQYPDHNELSMVDTMREDGVPVGGTSIGVAGERGGGTLGPFITLDNGRSVLNGAITSYHVVCPPRRAGLETKKKADRFGSQFGALDDTNVDVITFAMKDMEMTAADLQHLRETVQKSLDDANSEKEMREASSARVPQKIHMIIGTSMSLLKSYDRKETIMTSIPLQLGKVSVSSGKSLIDNKVGDWAIVDFKDNSLPQRNVMPPPPIPHPTNIAPVRVLLCHQRVLISMNSGPCTKAAGTVKSEGVQGSLPGFAMG